MEKRERWTARGAWVRRRGPGYRRRRQRRRRDARGCGCTAEPSSVDATAREPLQQSTLAFASPPPLSRSPCVPPPFLRVPSTTSLLFPPRQPRTRLVTPPFSLHPRSMTSTRGNASQRRLLSPSFSFARSVLLTRSLTLCFSPARSLVHSATTPLTPSAMQFVYIGAGLLIAIDSP